MSEINIKITNAKQLIRVLKDIQDRASGRVYSDSYEIYKQSIKTLIKVLEEAK